MKYEAFSINGPRFNLTKFGRLINVGSSKGRYDLDPLFIADLKDRIWNLLSAYVSPRRILINQVILLYWYLNLCAVWFRPKLEQLKGFLEANKIDCAFIQAGALASKRAHARGPVSFK
jgi:hypothetical protein